MNTSLVVPFAAIDQMRKLAEILYARGEINDAYSLASAITDVVQATGTPEFYAATPFGVSSLVPVRMTHRTQMCRITAIS